MRNAILRNCFEGQRNRKTAQSLKEEKRILMGKELTLSGRFEDKRGKCVKDCAIYLAKHSNPGL